MYVCFPEVETLQGKQLIGWPSTVGAGRGHGRPTPPLPVRLRGAQLCPVPVRTAPEAPPPERQTQHPAKHHPHPDRRPGPGAG